MHAKAEAQMAAKYGPEAWETMPNWGKVRNRLSQQNYDRYNQRMTWLAALVPAIATSAVAAVAAAILRG